jgi:hypothetical protein
MFIGDSTVDEETADAADIDFLNYKVFSKMLFNDMLKEHNEFNFVPYL